MEERTFKKTKQNEAVHCVSQSTNLSGSDFNVKVVPLVWNLEDFRPSKSVYPQPVFVHQEPVGTHAQHDVHPLRVLLKQNPMTHTTLVNLTRIFEYHLWKSKYKSDPPLKLIAFVGCSMIEVSVNAHQSSSSTQHGLADAPTRSAQSFSVRGGEEMQQQYWFQ